MKITFVTPHQGATSGGVYAIKQYATLLAKRHDVTLAVARGEPTPLSSYRVVPIEGAHPADVVLFPADMPTEGLPIGPPVCYLQGFGTPGNPVVVENLDKGHPVIASAKWLASEARKHGSKAFHVPYGLDDEVFFPGPPAEERGLSVLMMTHRAEWKGTADGLESLRLVQAMVPGVHIGLFGPESPDFPAAFHPSPNREQVSDLMREYGVFVCSSWEEGFGMPGLESMACGAALATTDTKGSRDYAIDGESALVVPPRNPQFLAGAIRTLLVELETRHAIAAGGIRTSEKQPSWAESALMFEESLLAAFETRFV